MSYKKQGGWLLISSALAGIVQLSIFAMLAYYTSPEVVGVLAIVNIFLGIAYLVQDMGLSNYFIYKQYLTRAEGSTLYFTNVILGFGAAALMALIAIPVGSFYASPDIEKSLYIMAVNFILLSLSAQYQANFIKNQRNIALAKVDIVIKLSLFLSTFILLKLDVPSIFPYLYSYLLVNTLRYFLLLLLADKKWHPTFDIDFNIVRPAITFGSFQMGSQIINQVKTQLDQLIIGKLMGVEVLGLYSFAKELILQPVKFVRILIGRLIYPKLAQLQDMKQEFYGIFKKSILLLSFINTGLYLVFLGLLVVLIDYNFVEYKQSIPILYFLVILGFLTPLGSLLGVVTQAKGNTKTEFMWSLISACISIIGIYVLSQYNSINFFAIGIGLLQVVLSFIACMFFSYMDKELPKKTYLLALVFNFLIYATINIIFN